MTLLNEILEVGNINKKEYLDFLIMLNPFAPHITEEIYQNLQLEGYLNKCAWVKYDSAQCIDETIEIVLQINGKVKSKLLISINAEKEEIIDLALKNDKISENLDGKTIMKQVYVPNKLVNFVAK